MIRPRHRADGAGAHRPAPGWSGIGTATLRDGLFHSGYPRPVLLSHHLLVLVTVGHGTQDVDFRTHQCRPGTLIWAGPGQVVRYGGQAGLDAIVLCWDATALAGLGPVEDLPAERIGTGHWQLAGEDEDAVISEVSQLVVDCQRHRPGGLAADLLRHQLAVLLLRLSLLPVGDAPTATGARLAASRGSATTTGSSALSTDAPEIPRSTAASTFRRLRYEVERSYDRTRRVEDYAGRLDCSVRTLTRACLATTGRSAKQIVDDRVALEAMRLLAATDEPIAEIGRRLGFPEPTNFGRFFQREVGRTPGAFRAGFTRPATARLPGQRAGEADGPGRPVRPAAVGGDRPA